VIPAQGQARRSRTRLLLSYAARIASASARSDVEQYLALVCNLTSLQGRQALNFSTDLSATVTEVARRFDFEEPLRPSQLRAIQRFELRTYLPGDLFCKEDRATMAVGLEGRVPLVDDALVDLAERTPEHRMMSLGRGKIILRELADHFGLPNPRRKRGFAVPLGAYFKGAWRGDAREWFTSAETDLVNRASAVRLLHEHAPPAGDLWMLATLIGWENRLKRARSAGANGSIAGSLTRAHG
jgi:asparagine synthase (glutamine-hydrolysing)